MGTDIKGTNLIGLSKIKNEKCICISILDDIDECLRGTMIWRG